MGTNMRTYWFHKTGEEFTEFIPWESEEQALNVERRNYPLFALLAGVRNGFGFSGIPIFTPITPCPLRNEGIHHCAAALGSGVHGYVYLYCWYTVEDLHRADWSTKFNEIGCVDREGYAFWKEGKPFHSCGYIEGPGIKLCEDPHDFEADPSYTHVRVNWDYRLDDPPVPFLQFLREKFPEGDPDNKNIYVQMVFNC